MTLKCTRQKRANGISRTEEKREPAVRHVCPRKFVLPCNCRAKVIHNLMGGIIPFFQEKGQNSAENTHI